MGTTHVTNLEAGTDVSASTGTITTLTSTTGTIATLNSTTGNITTANVDDVVVAVEAVHDRAKTQTKSANYTMVAADSGIITYVDTDAVVITLPATAVGLTFIIVNSAADGASGVAISPAAVDKITGAGLSLADDADLTNTKATSKKGDKVVLFGDGVDGWYITEMAGTWA